LRTDDVSLVEFIYIVFTCKIEAVPLVEFIGCVFTCIQMRVTVGDSGFCCCTCISSILYAATYTFQVPINPPTVLLLILPSWL